MSVGPSQPKKYGLIIPKSKDAAPMRKRPISSVFNVDSDEEEEEVVREASVKKKDGFRNMKRQAKIDIQRALEDDPTVYQYDEVYDEMKEEKTKKITIAKQDKSSKYAKNLLRNAAVRKLQNDRHFERKCQKELEDEGDEFADKESFITSSYKKKLEELETLEKEHKRMEEEDRRNDVTKKRDLTDFYRNILQQRTTEVTPSPAEGSAPSPTEGSAVDSPVVTPAEAPPEPEPSSPSSKPVIKRSNKDTKRSYRPRRAEMTRHDSTSDSGQSEPEPSGEPTAENPLVAAAPVPPAGEVPPEVKEEPVDPGVVENEDRDDSSSGGSDDDDDEGDVKPKVEPGEEEEEKVPAALLTAEEQRALRVKLIKEACKKRNTPETIQAAVERYWARRGGGGGGGGGGGIPVVAAV